MNSQIFPSSQQGVNVSHPKHIYVLANNGQSLIQNKTIMNQFQQNSEQMSN